MKKYILFFLSWCFMSNSFAELPSIALEPVQVDLNNTASVERGAKFFATNCMVCHTLIYLRYNKLAQKSGITYNKMPVNVTSWPNNIKPPDLSLEAEARGTDWIYTYLHSFYRDTARPTGFNNLIVPNTAMPNILAPYQGIQTIATDIKWLQMGDYHPLQWYDVVELQQHGSMTPAEFDATMTDVVNFLLYAARPYQPEQHRLGVWVLGFLLILFILMYLLKRQYWQDIRSK